jgi:hypothetical protein
VQVEFSLSLSLSLSSVPFRFIHFPIAYLGAARGSAGEGGHVDGAEADGAGLELLADVDRIRVSVVEELDELGDADIVAEKVADGGLNLVLEVTAESAAGAEDAAVQDDLEELVDGLILNRGWVGRKKKKNKGQNEE